MRRIAILWSLWLAVLAPRPAVAVDAVTFVLSERGGAYAQVAQAMRRELNGAADVTERLAAEIETVPRVASHAVVAVGTDACRSLAQSSVAAPLSVCVLLPKIAYDRIAEGARARGKTLSAVLLDQPLMRQMALIRLALPQRRRIAALLGPETEALGAALASSAAAQGLQVSLGRIESPDELGGVLQAILVDADALLAVPDSVVFNSHTIQNILRTAFKNRVPLVAFSPAYVRAGALIAVYSTPQQIGRQAGRSLQAALSGRAMPAQQHPQEFEVSVNPHVARSLGIDLDDEATLVERLRKMERAR